MLVILRFYADFILPKSYKNRHCHNRLVAKYTFVHKSCSSHKMLVKLTTGVNTNYYYSLVLQFFWQKHIGVEAARKILVILISYCADFFLPKSYKQDLKNVLSYIKLIINVDEINYRMKV